MFSLRNTVITLTASLFLITPTLANITRAASCPNVPAYSAVEEWGLDTPQERIAGLDSPSPQFSITDTSGSEDFDTFLAYIEYLDYLEQLELAGLLELFTVWEEQGYSEPVETWCEEDDIPCIYSDALEDFALYLAYIEHLDYLEQLDEMGLLDLFRRLSEPGLSDFEGQTVAFGPGEVIDSTIA